MGKLKALLLTQGMHGMISQVEGMAKALNTEYSHKIVRLSFPWNLAPPKFTPISEIILKDKTYLTENETPDLIISCGRKSVIPSILLKKKNSKIFTIHIQNPKVSFKNFDVIIAPEHDNLNGDNVYSSKGAIHYITEQEINKAKPYLSDKIKSQKLVSLILGGPNKYYSFDKDQLNKIFNEIRSNFISKGYAAIVIPSMRTPKMIIDLAIKEFGADGYVVNSVDKQAYLSAFALATNIVVTCDSTSMISEAATSGKPIFVAHMKAKKNNYRFKKFFKLFKEVEVSQYINNNETLYLYKTEKDYQAAKYSINLRKNNGVKIKELNAAEINELEPNIAPLYFCGLIFKGSRHTVNPIKVSKKIFESFLQKGGSFLNKKILEKKFKSLGIVNNNVVFSCGSSVTASVLGVAYSLINNKYMPTIYIGSWSEYGKIK